MAVGQFTRHWLAAYAKVLGILCTTKSGRHPSWTLQSEGPWEKYQEKTERRKIVYFCKRCEQKMPQHQVRFTEDMG